MDKKTVTWMFSQWMSDADHPDVSDIEQLPTKPAVIIEAEYSASENVLISEFAPKNRHFQKPVLICIIPTLYIPFHSKEKLLR